MEQKLKPEEVQQIPPWIRHFLVYVVKRSATHLVEWIDGMKEAAREARQIEGNGKISR